MEPRRDLPAAIRDNRSRELESAPLYRHAF